jgi:hypothetical protein
MAWRRGVLKNYLVRLIAFDVKPKLFPVGFLD